MDIPEGVVTQPPTVLFIDHWRLLILNRCHLSTMSRSSPRHFQREPTTVSEAVIKIESLMEKDMELVRRIDDMRNNLMKRGKRNTLLPLPDPFMTPLPFMEFTGKRIL